MSYSDAFTPAAEPQADIYRMRMLICGRTSANCEQAGHLLPIGFLCSAGEMKIQEHRNYSAPRVIAILALQALECVCDGFLGSFVEFRDLGGIGGTVNSLQHPSQLAFAHMYTFDAHVTLPHQGCSSTTSLFA